jgi:hypothetical protein
VLKEKQGRERSKKEGNGAMKKREEVEKVTEGERRYGVG